MLKISYMLQEGTLAFCYKSVVEFSDGAPNTVTQALSGDESVFWQEAIQSEVNSLISHDVWDTEPIPRDPSMVPIRTKFIFRKKDTGSDARRYKARLVAQGFSQIKGVNYDETFSGVVDKASLRMVLHIIASRGM